MNGLRVATLGLAVLVLAGCGSDGTKARRDAVNRYIADVQQAQADLVGHQGEMDAALSKFSLAQPRPQELRALRSARTRVERTLRRVRALDAPHDAARLDRLLLTRLTVQRSLLDELIRTSLDARRLTATTPTLRRAAATLHSDLAAIASAPTVPQGGSATLLERYGEAFGRYGDTLRPLPSTLAPARTPSLLRPTLDEQRSALTRSVALCDEIRRDLRRHDVAHANTAIHSLLTLASTLNGLAMRRAEARAARVYNARIARLVTLEQQVARERGRLVREIG